MRLAIGGYNALTSVNKAITFTSGRRSAYDRIELLRRGLIVDGVKKSPVSTTKNIVTYD